MLDIGRAVKPLSMLAAFGALVTLPVDACAKHRPRADLVVSKGAVAATGATLTGSFVVKNSGSARAGGTTAAVVVGPGRVVARIGVRALRRSSSRTVTVSVRVPDGLPAGALAVYGCADGTGAVRERSEANNCRRVGSLTIAAPAPAPAPSPAPAPAPQPASAPRPAIERIAYEKDKVLELESSESRYWAYVPSSYDDSHATPTKLFVWLHGCGGKGAGDIYTISPGGDQSYISVAVGGREGDCWQGDSDQPKVLAAIADIERHFNVDPRRVVVGGYSSGGHLAYSTGLRHAELFAGILIENSSPFPDPNSAMGMMGAASWKLNIVHLAHTGDEDYEIGAVRNQTDQLKAAGFPVTRIERPGTHWDDDKGNTGTDHDLRTYLLPHLDDGWMAP